MINTLRPFRAHLIALSILAVAITGCHDDAADTTPASGRTDTTGAGTTGPVDVPTSRPHGRATDPQLTLADSVYTQYARLAIGLSRREMDSIVKSNHPNDIQTQMEIRMRKQDTIARRQLAEKFGITRDSVDAILAARNVPPR